jgi:hypothetical protein
MNRRGHVLALLCAYAFHVDAFRPYAALRHPRTAASKFPCRAATETMEDVMSTADVMVMIQAQKAKDEEKFDSVVDQYMQTYPGTARSVAEREFAKFLIDPKNVVDSDFFAARAEGGSGGAGGDGGYGEQSNTLLGNARRSALMQAYIDADSSGETRKQMEQFEMESQLKAYAVIGGFCLLYAYLRVNGIVSVGGTM